ncbi:MAG: hypothetical protein ABI685_11605 [Ferruginibacter sp.]
MKKTIIKITTITICIFISFSAFAQQQVTGAKPPEVKGPVLQTSTDNKIPVASSTTDKDLHETATKQSSFTGKKPEKAKDETLPAKAPESQQQKLPQTNTMVPPATSFKNG